MDETPLPDISELYNPYDFANPVSDRRLFQGRDEEMREINYYLKQAKSAPRPINLALIGERAAGKTSFLNMIADAGRELSFCIASIDLNESDAESPLRLFFKIFDSLLTNACDLGAFGGLAGRTYQTYRDVVDTGSMPKDTTFCPFAFPLQYAVAQRHSQCVVSEALIKRDLRTIAHELNRTCILMFDECDVLKSSRVELEQLRNVFMNSAGYMLVFAGTPRLFPVLDDVFSPIVRQFKKIPVGAYADTRGTKRCMEAPLEAIGLELRTVVGSRWRLVLHQVHEVSGGRPYEIQLLCHFMFKRMQLAPNPSGMDLTYDILEDVRRELENAHDVEVRPVLAAIKRLDNRELRALGILTQASEHATLLQIAAIERICGHVTSTESLAHELACLVSAGILRIDEQDLICYTGDDFDRIYATYFAKSRGESLAIRSQSLRTVMSRVLRGLLSEGAVKFHRQLYVSEGFTGDLGEIVAKLASGDASSLLSLPTYTAAELVTGVLEGLSGGGINSIVWTCPWGDARIWFFGDPAPLRISIEAMDLRAKAEDSSVTLSSSSHLRVEQSSVLSALTSLPPGELRTDIAQIFSERAASQHLGDGPQIPSVDWLDHALRLCDIGSAEPVTLNNLGYMLLARDRTTDALPLLEAATHHAESDYLLALVNLCVAQLFLHDLAGGQETLGRINVRLALHPDELNTPAACLVIPRRSAEGLGGEELRQVPLEVGITAVRALLEPD